LSLSVPLVIPCGPSPPKKKEKKKKKKKKRKEKKTPITLVFPIFILRLIQFKNLPQEPRIWAAVRVLLSASHQRPCSEWNCCRANKPEAALSEAAHGPSVLGNRFGRLIFFAARSFATSNPSWPEPKVFPADHGQLGHGLKWNWCRWPQQKEGDLPQSVRALGGNLIFSARRKCRQKELQDSSIPASSR